MQRTCLDLIVRHYDPVEIARELGISKSTVESHLASARKLLGATRSKQAARIYDDYRRGAAPDPAATVPDPPSWRSPTTYSAPVGMPIDLPSISEQPSSSPWWRDLLPLRPPGAIDNDSSLRQRIFWLLFTPIIAAIGFGMLAIGFEVINKLVAAH